MGDGGNGALHKIIFNNRFVVDIVGVCYWLFMIFSFRWYVAKKRYYVNHCFPLARCMKMVVMLCDGGGGY